MQMSGDLLPKFVAPESFPYRASCEACAEERTHHHTGERTKGMPHEALNYYCWCLDVQPPVAHVEDQQILP